jgi:hypothetical protein
VLRLGETFLVDASNGLHAELRVMFGAHCILNGRGAGPNGRGAGPPPDHPPGQPSPGHGG